MALAEQVEIEPLPMPLRWLGRPEAWESSGGRLTITAGPVSDWFVDPGGPTSVTNAPALVGEPSGDFVLGACVHVDFASTFDAGVLLVRCDEHHWAKLCFEYSPQDEPMVVSVVTRGVSDDCNSFTVDGRDVWLRVARIGDCFAFHASTDGRFWRLIRYFALDGAAGAAVGFEAQSPTGERCTATFEKIRFEARRLGDLRNGE
jgi:regulation of enolase protein 1 (concanavalin A-like superfamily)